MMRPVVISFFVFVSIVTYLAEAHAAATKTQAVTKKVVRPKNLSTDIRFSDKDVQGKYQVPGEAIAAVEDEKALISLIEPRREFKDRLRKSVTQR